MKVSGSFRSDGLRILSVAAAVAAGCGAATIHALDADRAMTQYVRDEWGADKGYPGGPVYAITQTADGYLWIGAEKGLVRFDGLSFRLFEPKGDTTSAGPTVLGVAAAADGSVWARLRGVALVRYHQGALESVLSKLGSPESVVSAMLRGRGDTMLLATLARGAGVYRDGRFDPFASAADVPKSSFVISMAEIGEGEYWLGTRDAGLIRVRAAAVTRFADGLPDLKINCLLPGGSGDIWIGTDNGIARWSGSAISRAGVPSALLETPALAMIRDNASNVWIASGSRGLIRVNRQGTAAFDSHPRSDRHVSTLFEDRDGNIWVGTNKGIERWRDPLFTNYSSAQGLPPGAIGPVYVDGTGRAWFAPTDGGLYWMESGVAFPVSQSGLGRDVVYSIDGGGDDVWIGTQRSGVMRLRRSRSGLSVERFTHADGLAQDSVYTVARARDGAVWAGTLSGGASRLKQGVITTYDASTGLASNTVAAIVEGADGTIWFATPKGLSAFSRGGWRTYTIQDGLPSNDVNTLYEDPARNLWVGTATGLAVIQAGRVRALPHAPSGLRQAILGLTEDPAGFLWINAVNRVMRVNRDALVHAQVGDGDLREFGAADGLLALEPVKRHRTIVADGRGRIWLATNLGVSIADPALAEGRAQPPLTHVETISADGAQLDVHAPVRIPSSRRRIAFGYMGLSLSAPERVMYRYRLDGFDGDWSEPVAERQAVYTNLSPGTYRFRVIASNNDGLWSTAEGSLPFEIEPMFWEMASFQTLAVLLVGLGGWGVYRLRVRQMARQLNVRFEERLNERTRIAQELHDTLLQGFVSASMQLHVAVDKLPEDSPARPSMGRVLDLMRQVIDEGRNAVRGLRSPDAVYHDLEQAFSRVQQELAAGQRAEYRVIVEGRPRPLNPAIRDEIYRIGRESLANAFRHADATRIELELEYAPKELRMFVRDDGRGINPHVVVSGSDGHWGITGMRERAERIGGTLKIRSRAAAGTEVELRVPGRSAFNRGSPDAREKHP